MTNKKNRKGISGVLETTIMIALVLVAIVIIWAVVNNIIKENVKSTESCFGNFDKITLDEKYTCYEDSNRDSIPETIRFSLNIGEVDVDEVLVSISNNAETKSFKIEKDPTAIQGLSYYSGTGDPALPQKNGGKTYEYVWGRAMPSTIKIAPIIDGTQCEASDSISEIDDCSTLAT